MSEAPVPEVPKTLWQKLLEVQKAVSYLQRDAQSKAGGSYTYVSSAGVLGRIREEMDKQGLLLQVATVEERLHIDKAYSYQDKPQHFTECVFEFTWINADNPEETMASRWYGQGIDNGEKGPGKAMTYAEKYFFIRFFHIATGDHDDPDAGREEPEAAPAPAGEYLPDGRPANLYTLGIALYGKEVPKERIKSLTLRAGKSLGLEGVPPDWPGDQIADVYDEALKMHIADQTDAQEAVA